MMLFWLRLLLQGSFCKVSFARFLLQGQRHVKWNQQDQKNIEISKIKKILKSARSKIIMKSARSNCKSSSKYTLFVLGWLWWSNAPFARFLLQGSFCKAPFTRLSFYLLLCKLVLFEWCLQCKALFDRMQLFTWFCLGFFLQGSFFKVPFPRFLFQCSFCKVPFARFLLQGLFCKAHV